MAMCLSLCLCLSVTSRCYIRTIRYDTRCYFNVRSKADISPLNLPHGSTGAVNRLICLRHDFVARVNSRQLMLVFVDVKVLSTLLDFDTFVSPVPSHFCLKLRRVSHKIYAGFVDPERERGRNASAGRLLRSFITRRCAFCSPQLRASVCPSVRVGGCRRHKSLSICNNHAGALTTDRRASANARHLFPRAPIAPPPGTLVGGVAQWRRSAAYERSYRTSGPVTTGMGDRLRAPSRYVTSQLGQLSLASLRSR